MDNLEYLHAQEKLTKLKLTRAQEMLDTVAQEASQNNLSFLAFLDKLLEEEVGDRYQRTVRLRVSIAHFPYQKSLDTFDFSFQPSLDQKKFKDLATLRFIQNGENLILLGPPGVGKTHLAIGLGLEAIKQGHRVYFSTVQDLMQNLIKSYQQNRFKEQLRHYMIPNLLIIDEMGYVPLDKAASDLFFQLVSKRYEKGSLIITSNKSYSSWGEIFNNDTVIAAAILDRLLHHSTTISIRGESYRLKEKRKAGMQLLGVGEEGKIK